MLTLEQNKLNFHVWKLCSFFNLLPLEVDATKGEIRGVSSKMRRKIFFLFLSLVACDGVYVTLRLVQSLLHSEHFHELHFTPHLTGALLYNLTVFTAFSLFVQNEGTTVAIFNIIFKESRADYTKEREATRSWSKYSRQEILVLTFQPIMWIGILGVLIVFVTQDWNRPQLIFYSVPPPWNTARTFYALMSIELIVQLFIGSIVSFFGTTQLLVFLKLESSSDNIIRQLRSGHSHWVTKWSFIRDILKDMRDLILFTRMFNLCCANSIFGFKVLCLTTSIASSFLAIRHMSGNPIMGSFSTMVAFDGVVIFCVIYEKAFLFSQTLVFIKALALVKSRRLILTKKGGEVTRVIRSFPNIGIEVGGFTKMDKMSTPTFVGFVIQQLSALLVTFR